MYKFNLLHFLFIAIVFFSNEYLADLSRSIKWGFISISFLFDAYLFFFVFYSLLKYRLVLSRAKLGYIIVSSFLLLFVILRFLLFIDGNEEVSLFNFLRSARPLVYLLLLSILASIVVKTPLGPGKIEHKERKTLSIFVFWYSLAFILFYIFEIVILEAARPTFYTENNYEIPGLLLLVAAIFCIQKDRFIPRGIKQKTAIGCGFSVAILSLSISGVLEALVLAISRVKFIKTREQAQFFIFGALLVIVLVMIVIEARLEDAERSARWQGRQVVSVRALDRYVFLEKFKSDFFGSSSIIHILFGNGIASPLPDKTCNELDHFSRKMFFKEEVTYCNSVVYHIFFFRLVYDIGLVFAFLFLGLWFRLLHSMYNAYFANVAFLIIMTASLSISGFSSSVVIWPVFTLSSFLFLRRAKKSAKSAKYFARGKVPRQ